MPQQETRINDFVIKFANVNGSGSASANTLFAKSILRMGVPVSPRNIFPSNIQGLPTWYEVRVSEAGYLGRRGGVDMMVAMNPAHAGHLVGDDGHADAGAADQNAALVLAGGDVLGHLQGEIGIIHRVVAVGSQVVADVSLGLNVLLQKVLQIKAEMVTADDNLHRFTLSFISRRPIHMVKISERRDFVKPPAINPAILILT